MTESGDFERGLRQRCWMSLEWLLVNGKMHVPLRQVAPAPSQGEDGSVLVLCHHWKEVVWQMPSGWHKSRTSKPFFILRVSHLSLPGPMLGAEQTVPHPHQRSRTLQEQIVGLGTTNMPQLTPKQPRGCSPRPTLRRLLCIIIDIQDVVVAADSWDFDLPNLA